MCLCAYARAQWPLVLCVPLPQLPLLAHLCLSGSWSGVQLQVFPNLFCDFLLPTHSCPKGISSPKAVWQALLAPPSAHVPSQQTLWLLLPLCSLFAASRILSDLIGSGSIDDTRAFRSTITATSEWHIHLPAFLQVLLCQEHFLLPLYLGIHTHTALDMPPTSLTQCCSFTEYGKSGSSVQPQICLPEPTRTLRTFAGQVSDECLSPRWSDRLWLVGGRSWHLTASCRNVELQGTAVPKWEHVIV